MSAESAPVSVAQPVGLTSKGLSLYNKRMMVKEPTVLVPVAPPLSVGDEAIFGKAGVNWTKFFNAGCRVSESLEEIPNEISWKVETSHEGNRKTVYVWSKYFTDNITWLRTEEAEYAYRKISDKDRVIPVWVLHCASATFEVHPEVLVEARRLLGKVQQKLVQTWPEWSRDLQMTVKLAEFNLPTLMTTALNRLLKRTAYDDVAVAAIDLDQFESRLRNCLDTPKNARVWRNRVRTLHASGLESTVSEVRLKHFEGLRRTVESRLFCDLARNAVIKSNTHYNERRRQDREDAAAEAAAAAGDFDDDEEDDEDAEDDAESTSGDSW